MTVADLTNVCAELGFTFNSWVFLPNISHIVLSEDSILYPDDYHQYFFDNVHKLLLRRPARRDSNGIVIKEEKIELVVDYKAIVALRQAPIIPESERIGRYNDRAKF